MNHISLACINPSPNIIELAQHAFELQMFIETIEPIVLSYEKAIFESRVWYADPSSGLPATFRLTERTQICAMSKKDSDLYFSLLNQKRIESGLFAHDEDFCPLSSAESKLYQVQNKLLTCLTPTTGISCEQIQDRNRYIDFVMNSLARYLSPGLSPQWKWRLGHIATSLEDARIIVSIVVDELGLDMSAWRACTTAISPWEYTELSDQVGHTLSVGISAGGVVSVNGDPFTPKERISNITLINAFESVSTAFTRFKERDAFWRNYEYESVSAMS